MRAKGLTKETIKSVGMRQLEFPDFKVGDTIAVSQRMKEAGKERIQVFEGYVIGCHRNGISSTFRVRKMGAHGISVERIFPYYSSLIDSITLVKKGRVRRAKLYYLRKRVGKSARLKEKVKSRLKLDQETSQSVVSEKISEEYNTIVS